MYVWGNGIIVARRFEVAHMDNPGLIKRATDQPRISTMFNLCSHDSRTRDTKHTHTVLWMAGAPASIASGRKATTTTILELLHVFREALTGKVEHGKDGQYYLFQELTLQQNSVCF